ncbi:hypothetical protein MTO96_021725 [Rhipicephalus appendiculatus]
MPSVDGRRSVIIVLRIPKACIGEWPAYDLIKPAGRFLRPIFGVHSTELLHDFSEEDRAVTGKDIIRSPEDATPETLLTTAPVTDGALDPVVLRLEEKEAARSCTGDPQTTPLVIACSSRFSTPEHCRR